MKQLLAPALVCALFMLGTVAARAQTPGTGGPQPGTPDPDPVPATEVPLDGGVGLLLAGGVAYGIRRLRQRR